MNTCLAARESLLAQIYITKGPKSQIYFMFDLSLWSHKIPV